MTITCDDYLKQAESNEQAARNIKDTYPDWAVTICFYAALHWVEYYACVQGRNITQEYPSRSPHESRRLYVLDLTSELRNKNLRVVYLNLEDESKKARYMEGLSTNAKNYYSEKKGKEKVTQSLQYLQQVREILKSKL